MPVHADPLFGMIARIAAIMWVIRVKWIMMLGFRSGC
jgi:hypothetical protein